MDNRVRERQSGIELLKIVSMFVIVISHVIQSVGQRSVDYPAYNSMVIDITEATGNVRYVIMALVWSMVMWGVNVFFVSSAWFLCERKSLNIIKPIRFVINVWVVSVIFLAVYLVSGIPVSGKLIVKSLLPTLFSNNWFITCYLIMYLIHPLLNIVCEHVDRKGHLAIVVAGLIYCILTTVSENLLFYSKLIIVGFVYLIVVYVKKYEMKRADDNKLNGWIFSAALISDVLIILAINILGQNMGLFRHELMHMQRLQNPLLIVMALTSFNIFRNIDLHSKTVNHIAGLTLFIYIMHENILFRTYTRPLIWNWLIGRYGYDNILVCVIFYAIVLFIASIIVSELYLRILNKPVDAIANAIKERLFP